MANVQDDPLQNDPLQHGDKRPGNRVERDESRRVKATGTGTETGLLTGIFTDRESAERVYNQTLEHGYESEEINIIMSEDTRERYFSDKPPEGKDSDMESKAMEGTGAGSVIGGGLGAAAGIIAAVGTSIAIPGLGIIISGPIAAGLAGAGAGGITGGIIGALVGAGIPEEKAKVYESGVKKGNIVMAVKPHSEKDAEYLENMWRENKGIDVHH
ncbi:MAG: hypothetical protein WD317_07220 [Balneolaceae bacterium]